MSAYQKSVGSFLKQLSITFRRFAEFRLSQNEPARRHQPQTNTSQNHQHGTHRLFMDSPAKYGDNRAPQKMSAVVFHVTSCWR